MARRCDRPGCSEPGGVAYGFDAERRLVWLDTILDDDRAHSGALCLRHAGRLTAPQGWWLDDRRIEVPELFHEPGAVTTEPVVIPEAAEPAPPPKRRRRRKAGPGDLPAPEPATAVAVAVTPQPENLVPFHFDAQELAVVAEGSVIVDEIVVVEAADAEPIGGEVVVHGAVVVEDDASPLDPILEPSTPLLARAFTGTARTDRPHHRPRRNGSGSDLGEPPH